MAHTWLVHRLRSLYAAATAEPGERPRGGQAFMGERQGSPPAASASATASGGKPRPLPDGSGSAPHSPRIVIVGAGLAGLTAAYRLKQRGVLATVYEASDRAGGRCWTRRGFFEDGQTVERGGEFIDSGHREIRKLARELGLELDHLVRAEPAGARPLYSFDGRPYTYDEAARDFKAVLPRLRKDLEEAGDSTQYNRYTRRGYELDHQSVAGYIDEIVPGGRSSRFGRLLELAYEVEYGADVREQSPLNLLYLLGGGPGGRFRIYGDSDECFRIRGGNDRLPAGLAARLEGQVCLRSPLAGIERDGAGRIRLRFRGEGKEREVVADKAILAIPFSVLRTLDYEGAGFRPLKKAAIEELGMGANAKLHVQFARRFWHEAGNNGETFADVGYQQTFDSSRAQAGSSGILANYTGGETAARRKAGTEETVRATADFLNKLDLVLPGGSECWNGLSTLDTWFCNEWSRGAYSYWKVGQYTKFAGMAGEREGNILFAGEHTSVLHPGYMNGAVESGELAAREILRDLAAGR
ncbi:hypothetical protein J19TS2_36530 [Cohnella xylanilytica]|uniref:flavin monoamine oxidase family protein n=1 Tax=Cohnella xylanilytica TaxID=557555 RepID=UPI001B2F3B4A|nr:NAD(P)/FAD-dependent oxidoreductase [Cohnella xylanilytica]GIO14098.1 hypothetical protein J19TS2_36530 [Cohnella xylanilytica]